MARFQISEEPIKSAGSELQSFHVCMEAFADRIGSCRAELSQSAGSLRSVRRVLADIRRELLEEAAGMESLQQALEYAVIQYVHHEKQVCDCIRQAERRYQEAEAGTDKREPLEKLWDSLTGQERKLAYIATTEEQREAADRQMQEQIMGLMAAGRYTEEAWAQASVEERKRMLQDYMNEAADVMGISVKEEIHFFYQEPEDRILTNGAYMPGKEKIRLNVYPVEKLPPADSYYLMSTIIHELRHAYQHEALQRPSEFQVDQETLDQWKHNFRNYVDGRKSGYDSYRNQPLEADARTFAGQQ
ncbi:MAG: hypothetical protein KH452_01145 [Clostridiales bacterium]|nr:hypothetical protein [Clostridiales bacterium]